MPKNCELTLKKCISAGKICSNNMPVQFAVPWALGLMAGWACGFGWQGGTIGRIGNDPWEQVRFARGIEWGSAYPVGGLLF